jgi:orotidine-5'-phosphate decarboxylase
MTHPKFLVSEGGYVADEAVERIYRLACENGVNHFVVPGTKINWVKKIRQILEEKLGKGNFVLYAPGFISQGGDISECGQAAGDEWHAIVGSAIYGKGEPNSWAKMKEEAEKVTRQIAGG